MLTSRNLSLSLIFSLVLFMSCKTREDIVREQMIDNMSMQMQDGQKLNADFTVRLQGIEDRLNSLSGNIEENQHTTQVTLNDRIKTLEEKMSILESTQKEHVTSLSNIQKELVDQKAYIKEVLGTLKSISKKKTNTKVASPYDQAMNLYQKGKYSESKAILLTLIDKKFSETRKARIVHNLGMIAYIDKEDDKALAYFSRLFTEFPKTGYNKNGLMFLAKTLKRMNKKEEAKQALNELITRFPKAKQVAQAKKMLQQL
jgi:TolA-binding protein